MAARRGTRRRGCLLIAAVLPATMLGGTLPVPLYAQYEQQFGPSPLGVTVVFPAYLLGALFALVMLGDLSDQVGPAGRCWPPGTVR
jgi:MFS family permease